MHGTRMFKPAVQAMLRAAQEALRRCGLTVSQIRCLIPHQSNRRIIDAFAERLGAAPEQVFVNVDRYITPSLHPCRCLAKPWKPAHPVRRFVCWSHWRWSGGGDDSQW
jgi:hypothetical protein